MTLVWIGIVVLAIAVAMFFLMKPSAKPRPAQPQPARPAGARRVDSVQAAAEPTSAPAGDLPVAAPAAAPAELPVLPMPQSLADFRLLRADDLADEQKQAYAAQFRNIPRPPKLLDHLLSSNFVKAASSAQLVDLIVGEPLIAGRVLMVTNSPMFGLETPVSSIGQAVTYLGLNKVRSLCLQYILIASFKADSPERKRMLDVVWTASALASELTQQLGQRLDFDDRGSLVSAVVLSFIGRLATTASVSRDDLATLSATHGLLARTIAEQATLGLGAAQIGRLLMNDWGLPPTIVDDAAEIDSVLYRPSGDFDADRGNRLALCYLCARLGERLAEGELKDLSQFDIGADTSPEFFHLRSYLAGPVLKRLESAVRSPETGAAVTQTLAATHV
jgi:HD-like signal output (HDOD) protein